MEAFTDTLPTVCNFLICNPSVGLPLAFSSTAIDFKGTSMLFPDHARLNSGDELVLKFNVIMNRNF